MTAFARGKLFIFSAPSGTGKTTLCKAVRRLFPWLQYSVSYTTRPSRGNEIDGVDYHFIRRKEFVEGIENGDWAEWAEVHGYYYGTSAKFLNSCMFGGKDVLLDLDVQGTFQITKRYPESITVFIMPPSVETLRRRLEKRGTDSRRNIEKRLAAAEKEMAFKDQYHYVVVNDRLEDAIEVLSAIIRKQRTNSETL